jgi:hypothetical protein
MSRTAIDLAAQIERAEQGARWRRVHLAGDRAPEIRLAAPERPFWRPDAELVADEPDARLLSTFFPGAACLAAAGLIIHMLGWL